MFSSSPCSSGSPPPGGFGEARLPLTTLSEFPEPPLTAREMERLAKDEGTAYGTIHKQEVDGIQLEFAFSRLSKAFIKQDLYHHSANLFDWSFSQDQRRLIYYLLSKVLRKHSRRHRRSKASSRVASGKQV